MGKGIGEFLNQRWRIGAKHALYHKDGTWYHQLTAFPGALCDPFGYVVFDTQQDFTESPYLRINQDVAVVPHLSKIPGYTRVEADQVYQPGSEEMVGSALDDSQPNSASGVGDPDIDVEGLDKEEDASWGDYPIDTVLIRSESRTVHDILRRIDQGSFVMDPDFQRDFIWPDDKQSKLVESVLMRIPLPVFYLAEDDIGRMIVVDGLQRLSTFQRFQKNDLVLKLPDQAELNRKRFQDLSPKLQNRVEDCNLLLYIIDAKVPERARLDIFERVNGGIPLTRQQMRNCLFMGSATRFLKEEASTRLFQSVTGGSLKSATMRDREFVNRFCAFELLGLDAYKGDMDDFLARALKRMNLLSEEETTSLSRRFRNSLSNNWQVFNEHAFRKTTKGQTRRSVINASLWDVFSTGLAAFPQELVEAKAIQLRNATYALMANWQFSDAITFGTNDVRKVRYRFTAVQRMLKEVFDAKST